MPKRKNKKVVFVGLSGGVDSAVSAALLKEEGYQVVGVFIKTWHPDFIECNEEEERKDAMRIAAHLDIPFLTLDLEKVYKDEVADYMIREYRAGRTPNPDVMCNKEVKFGGFLRFALEKGADFVATGHYANLPRRGQGEVRLLKANDPTKDQSYFLWTLTQEQLSKILFPVGSLKKTEVRKIAQKYDLPVAEKKDSQGICFLGDIDLKDFLKHYIQAEPGKVLDEKGQVIGNHDGAVFHTLGERHGFTITNKTPNDKPYYIIGKDISKNTLIASQDPYTTIYRSINNVVQLENCNWISGRAEENKKYTAQIRYHGEFLVCKILITSKTTAKVDFINPVQVAPGQSIVIYDNEVCLGGGVVV